MGEHKLRGGLTLKLKTSLKRIQAFQYNPFLMNATTKPAVTDILPLNVQPSCGDLQRPRAANVLHNNAMPFHIHNMITLPQKSKKETWHQDLSQLFFFPSIFLCSITNVSQELHDEPTADPAGEHTILPEQLRQLARHTPAGHLPTRHKRPPYEPPDCYVQARVIPLSIRTGCKALSGCPYLLPHCWLFLLEYICSFPHEYYLGIDRQNPVIR